MKDATTGKPNNDAAKDKSNNDALVDLTDDAKREKLKRNLQGLWEYQCKTQKGSKTGNEADTFTDNVIMRGGVINIIVTNKGWAGISTQINGLRLWNKKASETKPTPLEEELSWKATGGVVADDVGLQFTYSSGDRLGAGLTNDTFYIETEEADFYLTPGNFTHTREDGKHVKGIVYLRRMKSADDLKWAPKGIHYIQK